MPKRNQDKQQNTYQTDPDFVNACNLFNNIPEEQLIMSGYNGIRTICYIFSIELQMLREKGPAYLLS